MLLSAVRIMQGLALATPVFFLLGQVPTAADAVSVPLGLLPIVWPSDNPYSPEKAELGRLLFFDKRLSADGSLSCASCHVPQHAFAEPSEVSTGIRGQKGTRNAPTVLNRAYSLAQFWDGRAATLEEQAKGPIANPIEMGNTHEACVNNLKGVPGYRALFARAFGTEDVIIDHVAKAVATFERTLLSGNSPYDRYKAGDKKALTPAQARGFKIFNKTKCDKCHEGPNFTSNKFHNLGVGIDKPNPDLGRYEITKDPRDWGAFKTPTLREIVFSSPYMHDGSQKTLDDVIEFYDKGGTYNKNLDPDIKPLKLTRDEKADLAAFLRALSGEGWQNIKAPAAFPQ
jgi:cytochrome c peroxidase